MNFNVFRLDVITAEVVEFYKSNLDIAKKQYEELINSTKPRGLDKTVLEGYYEMHHIKARCMGGEDIEDNLVLLTYKEHIIAHMLLFIINPEVVGLRFAFFMLVDVKDVRDIDSNLYIDLISLEYIRSEIYNSPEYKKKQSELAKNVWNDPEFRKKQSEIRNDPEFRKKLSEISKNIWNDPEFRKKQSYNKQCCMCISPDNIEYKSITEASKSRNIPRQTLSRWVRNGKNGWKCVKKS